MCMVGILRIITISALGVLSSKCRIGSIKLLQALARTIILGFEPWRDPGTRFFCSLLDMYMFGSEDASTIGERALSSAFLSHVLCTV
jgi:hypothetical protein